MSKITAVCTSTKKGTKKNPVEEVIIEEDYGVAGDAHADCQTHRQVSDCIMPREVIFAKVIHGGTLRPGDSIKVNEGK